MKVLKNTNNQTELFGLMDQDFVAIKEKFDNLVIKSQEDNLSDEEEILCEVLYELLFNTKHDKNYDLLFNRRLGYLKALQNKE